MPKKNKQKTPIKTWFHRKKKKNRWQYIVNDKYTIKAKSEWYRARSAYKLLEIQDKFNLIKSNFLIIDIWSAPWSFLQVISKIINKEKIIWIDLKEIKTFPQQNIYTIVWNIFDYNHINQNITKIIWDKRFDLITSDLAPNTSWRFDVDQYASVELNIEVCNFSDKFLKKWWNMLLKVFKWEDFYELVNEIKKRFTKMKTYKPLASRDFSREEYVICLWKK